MHGYTLARLVGLSRHAIMYYENSQTEPLLEDLKKIAVALDVEADKLYDDYYRFLDYPYGDRIKLIRTERKLYQRELAAIIGVDRRTAEKWERGKTKVTREMWCKLKELSLI